MTRGAHRTTHPLVGAIVTAVIVGLLCLGSIGCGDGRPAFCDDFAKAADLKGLRSALDTGDLTKAEKEAARLERVARDAPADVRSDLQSLAKGVSDIVDLIAADRSAAPAGSTTVTTSEPADVERQREALDQRLGDLSTQSARVATWASRNCGLDLG